MKNNSYYYFPIILSAILVLACKKNISPENTSNNNVIKQSSNSNDVRKIIPIENIGPKVTSDWDNNQKLLKAILDSANSSSAVREGDLTVLVGELCASGFTQQTLDWININIGAGNARNNMIASAINMSDESIPILFASIEKMAYNDEKSSAYDAITMKLSRMRLEELNILVKNTNKSTKYSDIMGSALATKIDRMGFNNHDGDEFQVAFGLITDLLNIQSKPGQAVL